MQAQYSPNCKLGSKLNAKDNGCNVCEIVPQHYPELQYQLHANTSKILCHQSESNDVTGQQLCIKKFTYLPNLLRLACMIDGTIYTDSAD